MPSVPGVHTCAVMAALQHGARHPRPAKITSIPGGVFSAVGSRGTQSFRLKVRWATRDDNRWAMGDDLYWITVRIGSVLSSHMLVLYNVFILEESKQQRTSTRHEFGIKRHKWNGSSFAAVA